MKLFQVRFHPLCPDILASGSLDHEVRLWNAKTAECIGSRDFCNSYHFNIYYYCNCIFYKLIKIAIHTSRNLDDIV